MTATTTSPSGLPSVSKDFCSELRGGMNAFFLFPFTYLLDYFLGEILLESEMPCLMAGVLEELRVYKAPILPDPEREPAHPSHVQEAAC